MKLDSTECRALMELVNRWDPHVFIDMHTTNGSWHRYALTYDVPHNPASPASIRTYMRQTMMPWVTSELEKKDIATFYYGNFNRDHTRWSTFGDFPRFGTEYMGLRGRLPSWPKLTPTTLISGGSSLHANSCDNASISLPLAPRPSANYWMMWGRGKAVPGQQSVTWWRSAHRSRPWRRR